MSSGKTFLVPPVNRLANKQEFKGILNHQWTRMGTNLKAFNTGFPQRRRDAAFLKTVEKQFKLSEKK